MTALEENIRSLHSLLVEHDVQSFGLLSEEGVTAFIDDLCDVLEEVGYELPEEMTLEHFLEGLDEVLQTDARLDEGLKQFLGRAGTALKQATLKALPKGIHQKLNTYNARKAVIARNKGDNEGFQKHVVRAYIHRKHADPEMSKWGLDKKMNTTLSGKEHRERENSHNYQAILAHHAGDKEGARRHGDRAAAHHDAAKELEAPAANTIPTTKPARVAKTVYDPVQKRYPHIPRVVAKTVYSPAK